MTKIMVVVEGGNVVNVLVSSDNEKVENISVFLKDYDNHEQGQNDNNVAEEYPFQSITDDMFEQEMAFESEN